MIKKFLQDIFNKWVVGIGTALIIMFGSALIDYFNRFYTLPEKVEEIHKQRKQDSILASSFIIRIEKIERRNLLDSIYLEEDFRQLQELKPKTKIKWNN